MDVTFILLCMLQNIQFICSIYLLIITIKLQFIYLSVMNNQLKQHQKNSKESEESSQGSVNPVPNEQQLPSANLSQSQPITYTALQDFFNKMATDIGKAIGDKLENKINQVKEGMNGLKADVNELKTDVNGLKADVNGLKADVNGLKADVNELKNKVNQIQNKVDKIQNKMENGEKKDQEKFVELKERLDILKESLDKHFLQLNQQIALLNFLVQQKGFVLTFKFQQDLLKIKIEVDNLKECTDYFLEEVQYMRKEVPQSDRDFRAEFNETKKHVKNIDIGLEKLQNKINSFQSQKIETKPESNLQEKQEEQE